MVKLNEMPEKIIDRIKHVAEIKYLTVKEIAWLFGVDESTVRRYIGAGALEAVELPRNPQSVEEANGETPSRNAKHGYRVEKKLVAAYLHITVEDLNEKLIKYYTKYPNRKERKLRRRNDE